MLSTPGLMSVSPALSVDSNTGPHVPVARGRQGKSDVSISMDRGETETEKSDWMIIESVDSPSSTDEIDQQAPLRVAFVSRFLGEQAS